MLVVLGIALVPILIGCSETAGPAPSETPAASPSEPQPSEAQEDDDTVFTVDAKVRAVDGTTMEVSLAGHAPVASTDPAADSLTSDFVERCGALGGTSPEDPAIPVSEDTLAEAGSSLMLLEFTATPDGHTFFAPLDLGLGSQYAPKVAFGESAQAVSTNESCIGLYQVTGSGTTTAITQYTNPSGTPDLTQWVSGYYGFSVPVDSGASIESCAASVADAGAADTADAPGWDQGTLVSGVSCGIGYIGE